MTCLPLFFPLDYEMYQEAKLVKSDPSFRSNAPETPNERAHPSWNCCSGPQQIWLCEPARVTSYAIKFLLPKHPHCGHLMPGFPCEEEDWEEQPPGTSTVSNGKVPLHVPLKRAQVFCFLTFSFLKHIFSETWMAEIETVPQMKLSPVLCQELLFRALLFTYSMCWNWQVAPIR